MHRFIIFTALAVAAPAFAQQACAPREYAQYKDDAKSKVGRFSLASEGCRLKIRQIAFEKLGNQRAAEKCEAEIGKARDALKQSKDSKAVQYMDGDCQGEYLNAK
jgi:hypothetical protein